MGTKECNRCAESKLLSEFHANGKGGIMAVCKTCHNAQSNEYHHANRDARSAYAKEYYRVNKEKIKARLNKEKRAAWHKANYQANREKRLADRRKYRQDNKESITIYKHSEHGKTVTNKRLRKRYLNDLQYRITACLRARVYDALKGDGKSDSTLELLGCTIEEVTQHLESQFTEGMSWKNHGAWHIDHIRPVSSFDLTDIEQQKECFNYKNLQPLWARDNLAKGASYEECTM